MDTPLPTYKYQPLESSTNIRVLVLEPASYSDVLKAQLVHVDRERLLLGQGTPDFYEAISYCWGDPTATHHLLIEEKFILPISSNVDVLLRHLRSSKKHRYFWLDAVCLDQHNDREKQVQVSLMGRIYSQAVKIRAWIGSGAEPREVESLFTALKWMATCLKNKSSPTIQETLGVLEATCGSDWESLLSHFFTQPYFERRWILQELALGHHITLHCGPQKIAWEWFLEGVRGFQKAVDQGLEIIEPRVVAAIRTILAIPDSGTHKLLTLLWRFHESQCSESQDRIFALYGLAQDAKEIGSVDYSEHWSQTFARVAGFYFRQDKKSIWLHLAHFGSLAGRNTGGTRYPSWIPDWNNTRKRSIPMPDNNTTLLSLSNFSDSRFLYDSVKRIVEFEGYYAGRVEKVSTPSEGTNITWHEGNRLAISEVLLSFFQRPYGVPTDRFEEMMRQHGVSGLGSRYLREALLASLSSVGPWSQSPPKSTEENLQGATMAMLDSIWNSYDIIQIHGKRDAIGVCVRGVQLGDVLVVPPQGPANSLYWPYKGRPLFGIVVRPDPRPITKAVHTKGQFPLYQMLSACRFVGLCSFALWEQSCYSKLDRASVQLV